MKAWIGVTLVAAALAFSAPVGAMETKAVPQAKAQTATSDATDFSAHRRYARRYYRYGYRPYYRSYYRYGYRPYYRSYYRPYYRPYGYYARPYYSPYYGRPYYYRPYPYYAPAPFMFGFGFGPFWW